MYKFIVLFALIAVVHCATKPIAGEAPVVEVLRNEQVKNDDGSYNFVYETSDGSYREEKGVPINDGSDEPKIAVTGFYRYIDDEGEQVEVHYTADNNGFIPEGNKIRKEITQAARDYAGKQH